LDQRPKKAQANHRRASGVANNPIAKPSISPLFVYRLAFATAMLASGGERSEQVVISNGRAEISITCQNKGLVANWKSARQAAVKRIAYERLTFCTER
jgi:hypothetical protein